MWVITAAKRSTRRPVRRSLTALPSSTSPIPSIRSTSLIFRVLRTEATASWTYASATIRQANGAVANAVFAVTGLAEDPIDLAIENVIAAIAGTPLPVFGVGVDSTTVFSGTPGVVTGSTTAYVWLRGLYRVVPSVGYHAYNWLEQGTAGSTFQVYNTLNGVTNVGLHGWVTG